MNPATSNKKNILKKCQDFYNKQTILCLLIVIAAISLFVYRNFIFGNYYFIYGDVATDSYSQSYPLLSFIAQSIWTDGYPLWSFHMGLGQNLLAAFCSFGDPFNSIVLLSGKSAVPYMMGLMQMIKPVCAGIFFYLYLKKLTLSKNTAFIFAILYAFCGHMIVRGAWLSYPNEVVWAAFALFAIESYIKKSNWKWIPLAVCILCLSLKGYYSLVYTLVLFIYTVVRYFSEYGPKGFPKFIGKYIGVFVLGLAVASVIIIPSVFSGFSSPRISGSASVIGNLAETPVFAITHGKDILSAFFRTISMDVLGTGSNFTGSYNYLESPLFYVGSLAVLLAPQAFLIPNRKRRAGIIVFFAFAFIYMFFPYVRLALSGFAANYYKHASFLITIIIAYAGAITLENIFVNKKISIPLLIFSLCAVAFLFVFASARAYGFVFQKDIICMLVVFLAAYSVLLCLFAKNKIGRILFFILLICTVCSESVLFASNSVNNRVMLTKEYINNESPFVDNSKTAVDWINTQDNAPFFRTEQTMNNDILTKALFQGYYGTRAYYANPAPYINFLEEVHAGLMPMDNISRTNYIIQFIDRYKLNTLLSVQYLIAQKTDPLLRGFESVQTINNLEIRKNKYALPFGFTYDKCILYEDFAKLSDPDKDNVLLEAFVSDFEIPGYERITVPSSQSLYKPFELNSGDITYTNINASGDPQKALSYTASNDDPIIGIPISINGADVRIKFTLTINEGTADKFYTMGQFYWAKEGEALSEQNSKLFYEYSGTHEYDISLDNADFDYLRFDPSTLPGSYELSNLKIYTADASESEALYAQKISERKQNAMEIRSFSQNKITASINLPQDRLLFLSMPYDIGWSAVVDGQPVPLSQVNIGFTGIFLTSGAHTITLQYWPPYLTVGIIVSVSGLAVYMLLLIALQRKKKQQP